MSYARSEPVASVLEERQKQFFYSYQCPYLKTKVNITAQLALLELLVSDQHTPFSNYPRDMGPRVKFLLQAFWITIHKAVINQVTETHLTADPVSTFHATPTSITFSPGLHDIVTI